MRVLLVGEQALDPDEDERSPAPVTDGLAPADRQFADALRRAGVQVRHASWDELAVGAAPLDGVDLVHLLPSALRHGPRSGDRRVSGRPTRLGLPWRLDRRGSGRGDRRSATGVLAHLPRYLPVVLSLPVAPPGDVCDPVVIGHRLPGSRPVHLIAADAATASGLESVLPGTHAASLAEIGRGFTDPVDVPPFRVAGPVVLAVTTPGHSREAVTVLRAAGAVGRTGLRFTLVLAGVGPAVRGASRAAALAEAAGVGVRFLGRATAAELARWRATATVGIASSVAEGADSDLADMLLTGVPVLAPRGKAAAEIAAQARLPPVWYAADDADELATRLEEQLLAAPGREPPVDEAAVSTAVAAGASPGRLRLAAADDRSLPARALPSWDDIAQQTCWVYQKALRSPRS